MPRSVPSVWYVAAGYKLPAGIEAYLLHYATEIRKHGFAPRIIVFEPLPKVPHRFLVALRERGIPIESLYARIRRRAWAACIITYIPWRLRQWAKRARTAEEAGGDKAATIRALMVFWHKRLAVRRLGRMIEREKPDIIHVKGRLITEAWPVFPAERTIYQHALMGTRDPSWDDNEAAAFSVFLNRIARIFVQGQRIADLFAQAFHIRRPIEVVFTMAPDEYQNGRLAARTDKEDDRHGVPMRFGILCRFTEQKGIPFLLEAIKLFKDRHGAVDFTFAGQGPLADLIREFAKKEGLDGNGPGAAGEVRIVPVQDAAEILGTLDVFVHPGLDDAMPVAVVEALMCGVPCIVSNVGASPELVRDGIEGLVIDPASSRQICAAMERFADMRIDEYAEFRRRARVRYEEACRPEVIGAQVAGLYGAVLQDLEKNNCNHE